MKRINILFIFIFSVPSATFSQQSDLLEKYRSMAVEYNHDLKAADKHISASIELEKAARKDLRPKLSVQAAGLDNVVLTGWVEHRIIKALAPKCAVGLFPYPPRFDFIRNLPNKFFEYIGEGMPIVSCLEGEVQRQIEQNDCGVMYKVGDPQDLARVLCQVRDDPAWRASMAENARTLAKRFDATKVYADLVSHLEAIAEAHRDAALKPAGAGAPGRSGAALASR